MRIDSYEFGRIVVDGREYSSDVILSMDGVMDGWLRREGHKLRVEDISGSLDENSGVLIVGTGYSGRMEVLPETREFIEHRGIELRIEKTNEACRLYNEISGGRSVIAALHLTC